MRDESESNRPFSSFILRPFSSFILTLSSFWPVPGGKNRGNSSPELPSFPCARRTGSAGPSDRQPAKIKTQPTHHVGKYRRRRDPLCCMRFPIFPSHIG